jgi:phospholipid/cholesterol/gamma-HCH transport system ATP-binding protein
MTATENDRVILIEGLKKSFNGDSVLDGLDLQLAKKENLVILGKSGSGKSVLIKCLVKLIEPDAGSINVLGYEVASLRGDELMQYRRKIGFLFQGGALYDSMSVLDNLLFPVKRAKMQMGRKEMEEKALDILERINLKDTVDKRPKEISGGMKKRVALARALMLDPEIVFYDEPTTGLDTATSREISELIVEMQETYNVSSLIITHDMVCTKTAANRICMIRDGKIAEEGTYESLSERDDPWVSGFFA